MFNKIKNLFRTSRKQCCECKRTFYESKTVYLDEPEIVLHACPYCGSLKYIKVSGGINE